MIFIIMRQRLIANTSSFRTLELNISSTIHIPKIIAIYCKRRIDEKKKALVPFVMVILLSGLAYLIGNLDSNQIEAYLYTIWLIAAMAGFRGAGAVVSGIKIWLKS